MERARLRAVLLGLCCCVTVLSVERKETADTVVLSQQQSALREAKQAVASNEDRDTDTATPHHWPLAFTHIMVIA